jgi:hypothetical protein
MACAGEADQVLSSMQQVAGMGLMGLGGLVAVAGGLLFLVEVAAALWRGRTGYDGGR